VGHDLLTVRNSLQDLSSDLDYLAKILKEQIGRVDEVKQLASDQMEIFDKRRNRIIGLLIAVYVPLAFATVRRSSPSCFRQLTFDSLFSP
jgi:hypothetical protein